MDLKATLGLYSLNMSEGPNHSVIYKLLATLSKLIVSISAKYETALTINYNKNTGNYRLINKPQHCVAYRICGQTAMHFFIVLSIRVLQNPLITQKRPLLCQSKDPINPHAEIIDILI